MANILCYGDSNTHGTLPMKLAGVSERHAPGDRWPDAMAEVLGDGHSVISEGLPGRTTVHDDEVEGGQRNGILVLPAILHSHKPLDLVILMLGTNDLKNRFSVSAYEIGRSIERMVQEVRLSETAKDVMIVSPAPVRECGTLLDVFAGAEARQVGQAAYLRAVAERLGCGFVDAGETVVVSDKDGVHWEADAHRAFGKLMAEAVKARLA
jgi:lysophospholipase L1-like esterase